jgi:SHAQKYF class myb-like DNA-binding protein
MQAGDTRSAVNANPQVPYSSSKVWNSASVSSNAADAEVVFALAMAARPRFDSNDDLGAKRKWDEKSSGSGTNMQGRWTEQEQELFVKGLEQYGKVWENIQLLVTTRTQSQIRMHAQRYFKKLSGWTEASGEEFRMREENYRNPKSQEEWRTASGEVKKIIATESGGESVASFKESGFLYLQGHWTQTEQEAFVTGLTEHGKDWKRIQALVKTRTLTQIRTHAQKYFKKMGEATKNGVAPSFRVRGQMAQLHSTTNIKGHWTEKEHDAFVQALNTHGKDWKRIQNHVKTRTLTQIRTHAQKHFHKIASKEESLVIPL